MYGKRGGWWGAGGAELFNIMVRHCAENHPAPVWVGFEEDVHGAWSVRVLGDHERQDDLYGHQGNSKQRQSLLGHPRLDQLQACHGVCRRKCYLGNRTK